MQFFESNFKLGEKVYFGQVNWDKVTPTVTVDGVEYIAKSGGKMQYVGQAVEATVDEIIYKAGKDSWGSARVDQHIKVKYGSWGDPKLFGPKELGNLFRNKEDAAKSQQSEADRLNGKK